MCHKLHGRDASGRPLVIYFVKLAESYDEAEETSRATAIVSSTKFKNEHLTSFLADMNSYFVTRFSQNEPSNMLMTTL